MKVCSGLFLKYIINAIMTAIVSVSEQSQAPYVSRALGVYQVLYFSLFSLY